MKICGDLTPLKGPCIIVMNHRTRFDWMFLWCFIIRLGDPPRHKIILKSSLKRVPGFGKNQELLHTATVQHTVLHLDNSLSLSGWGMQVGQFLFLSRKWAQDEKYMSDTFAYFNETQYPLQLLLFPEGTDLSDSNKQKSHKFAEQNGLPKYEYVLNTRTKGFIHCVQELRKSPSPLSVVNMSVAYVGSMPQNESDIVAGNWPDEIHFYAKHVPPTELPRDDKGLEEWIKHCWDEKEKQLENFYLNKKFDAPYMEEEELNQAHSAMYTGIAFWSALLAAVFYCLFYYPLVVLGYFLLTTLFFVAVNLFTQGMDCTALKLHQMGWR